MRIRDAGPDEDGEASQPQYWNRISLGGTRPTKFASLQSALTDKNAYFSLGKRAMMAKVSGLEYTADHG
jgi:hypothetical protein